MHPLHADQMSLNEPVIARHPTVLVWSSISAAVLISGFLGVRSFKSHRRRVASRTVATIAQLEERVQRDEGRRGIQCLVTPGELHAAAKRLVHSSTVAIITGFPCLLKHDPPTETDGPPGAYAIARACIALGHKVYILTDEVNEAVLLAGAANSGLPGHRLHLESFPPKAQWSHREDARLQQIGDEVDLIVAVERAGPGVDGSYYTMRGLKMDDVVSPLERLLTHAPRAWSIGVGDGGNEVGMAKVRDALLSSSIPNAALIGCAVATDHLIVSSVSNWGAYALANAAALVAAQEGVFCSREEAVSAMVVSEEQEGALIHRLVEAGARDGVTAERVASVDGMSLETSLGVLRDLRNMATACSWMW